MTDPSFALTPEIICELNRLAVDGLVPSPGMYRTEASVIVGSKHVPPSAADIPAMMGDLVEQIATGQRIGVELAAYALWRLAWIHPFEDGNGRTARMIYYFLLCRWSGGALPGTVTVPDRILSDKLKFYRCLEEADGAFKRHKVANVSHLTGYIERHLRGQLEDAHLPFGRPGRL